MSLSSFLSVTGIIFAFFSAFYLAKSVIFMGYKDLYDITRYDDGAYRFFNGAKQKLEYCFGICFLVISIIFQFFTLADFFSPCFIALCHVVLIFITLSIALYFLPVIFIKFRYRNYILAYIKISANSQENLGEELKYAGKIQILSNLYYYRTNGMNDYYERCKPEDMSELFDLVGINYDKSDECESFKKLQEKVQKFNIDKKL